jgi:hypothetical protein
METTEKTLVLKLRTLYFLYNPETKKAVTRALKYTELMDTMKNGQASEYKLGELTYDFYKGKTIALVPEDAIPMEVKYRKPEHLQEDNSPEAKPKRVKMFTIREPIWKDPRSVGLNCKEIEDAAEDVIGVKITYRMRKKNDELLYPEPFFMDREEALSYPVQKVAAGTRVTIIPIQDFRDRA